jgi:hypothetical protein
MSIRGRVRYVGGLAITFCVAISLIQSWALADEPLEKPNPLSMARATGLFAITEGVTADDSDKPASQSVNYRGSYYVNGEIHVGTYGQPEGKPLTTGHHDFKPSWSKTGDMLVFFRRVKNDPDVSKWKTAIHIINADGTGLHQLTDGAHTDFNQTWTRDGKNTPIWNRRNPKTGGYVVMASKIGAKPGEEFRHRALYLGFHLPYRRSNPCAIESAQTRYGVLPDDAWEERQSDVRAD